MIEEKVLDALDLLSDDLIRDVDALRQRGRPVSRAPMLRRWGGLAACLCLLIAGGLFFRLILTPMGGSGGASGDAAPAAPGGMGADMGPTASNGTAPEEFEGTADDFREPSVPIADQGDQSISSESDGIQSGSPVPEPAPEPSGSPTSPAYTGDYPPGVSVDSGESSITMAEASTLTLRIESWQPEGFTAIVVDVGDSPVFALHDRIEVRFEADSSILLPDGSLFSYGSASPNADQIPVPVGSLVEVAFSAFELDPGSGAAGRVYALRFAPAE